MTSGRRMLRVHAHDARVVHHLEQDHDVVVGLHDPLEVVVEAGEGRRDAGEAEQAALGAVADLHVVVGTRAALLEPPGGAVVLAAELAEPARQALLRLRRHRRHLAVLGIDQDRGPELAVDREGVRRRDRSRTCCSRRRCRRRPRSRRHPRAAPRGSGSLAASSCALRAASVAAIFSASSLVRYRLSPYAGGPRQRRERGRVVGAGEVGLAGRGARNLVRAHHRDGQRDRKRTGQSSDQCRRDGSEECASPSSCVEWWKAGLGESYMEPGSSARRRSMVDTT